ncbi:MAG: hypothetical protein ACFFDW_02450 [Candidatus Thorarchaeota archaeon]
MSKIIKGDFIKITYDLRVKETNQLIETTDEKLARKENLFDEKQFYGPRLMIVGNEELYLKKLNEEIVGKTVGDKFKVEIPPEDTFGYRDPSKVKLLGRKELIAKNIVPEIGKQIQWGNQTGVVRSMVSGRVRVDFNHPLVGHVIVYTVNVVEKISNLKKKLEALIDFRMPGVELNKFTIKDENNKITIELPEDLLTKDPYIQFRKARIASDINSNFPNYKEINFIDKYSFPETK